MKRILILLSLVSLFAVSCKQVNEEPQMDRISISGNHFVTPDGKEFRFEGLCLADPVRLIGDGHWDENLFAQAADWGANVVRFPIHPTNINQLGWDETFAAIDEGIEWAKKYNMYVVIDWHSIGNLKTEKYTSPMYNTTWEETIKFWTLTAEKYKDEPTVALYELFNEPTYTAEGLGEITWTQWKGMLEQIIDTIRAIDPKALCMVAGFNWAYDLTPVATEPIERENVVYVSHPYPQKRDQPWEEQWEKDFGYVADKYPVFLTEMGYCLPEDSGSHIPVMSTDVYAEHITKYIEDKGMSYTVWCFDPYWAPMLIADWDYTLTTSGKWFKPYMQARKAARDAE